MQLDVDRLRALRARAQALNDRFVEDLKPFLRSDNTFFRLPEQDPAGISVTTTCTCLMAAVLLADGLKNLYEKPAGEKAKEAFEKVANSEWCSSGLEPDNNFTRILALRAAGFLRHGNVLADADLGSIKHNGLSLPAIARQMAANVPESFRVGSYPPKSALGYWFLDAIERLGVEPEPLHWVSIADWASEDFSRQLSYVVAGHDALLDPVAMIMAACVVKRLHQKRVSGGLPDEAVSILAPVVELRHSVSELFRFQVQSGIWPKYFPLFHYEQAGSNYCFTFEFLEALLNEFGEPETNLFEIPPVLPGLERAVEWCDQNRMVFRRRDRGYPGWNSGAEINKVRAGIPESWATATVHMFLAKLCQVLSEAIDHSVVTRYYQPRRLTRAWAELIDVEISLSDSPTTFKKVIQEEIIEKLKSLGRSSFRLTPIRDRSSALLFGPPGTSKTTFVRALAEELKWPYIEINPSHFLGQGLEQIYGRTNEIFTDLIDLSGVVVLFDEMDALVQSRKVEKGQERLDAVRQLLTTSMLPKLSALHDRKQVVYFMATNDRAGLDPAIMRAGRFDMLLHIAPPKWKQKLEGLEILYKDHPADVDASRQLLQTWTLGNSGLRELLDFFTFSEVKSLLDYFLRMAPGKNLSAALTEAGLSKFSGTVQAWGEKQIMLRKNRPLREEFEGDRKGSALQ